MARDYRRDFADFEGVAYLNTAGQSAIPLAAARAAQAAIEWKKLPHTIPEDLYFDLPDRIRGKIACLIGAEPEEIAVTTGASGGLTAVAAGIAWRPGDEVLVAEREFPAHFAAWIPYERAGLLRVRILSPRGNFITADDFIENLTPQTRLVSASYVRFDDGSRLDAARVGEACRARGVAFLLDVSQFAGSAPLRIRDLGADFAVSAGYKFLLSPYGTGFFWVRRESLSKLATGPLYWTALEGARDFHSLPLANHQVVPGARRWDSPETTNFFNLAAMDASLDFISEAGPQEIERHIGALQRELIERLPRDRCVLRSPADPHCRGPFVCVAARTPEDTRALYEKLRAAQIYVSLRENALRISPHLYNTPHDIARLIQVLSVA